MKRPFNIFPNIGYRNSQFQIVSSVDNLRIDFYNKDKIIKTVEAHSLQPTLLTSLNVTGIVTAKCRIDNRLFHQELEIKEAFRLGSSEFKKAFVFDNTNYSFFLMKDRLLLYDEKRKTLLTENHYSPTEIHQINSTNFLFVTKIGSPENGIVNLGIYNIETFSIVGELLNNYKEIKILVESNKVWLYNIKLETIHCFGLVHESNKYFRELKIFKDFKDYFLDDTSQNIFINYNDVIQFSNLKNILKSHEISKKTNNAIDKKGNVFIIENNILNCTRILTNHCITAKIDFTLNLQNEEYIHLGYELRNNEELTDLNLRAEVIKNKEINFLSKDKVFHRIILSEDQRISETYTTHKIYPTNNGVFIIHQKINRKLNKVECRKRENVWTATPCITKEIDSTLSLYNSDKAQPLIDKTSNLTVSEYKNSMLLVNNQNNKLLLYGNNSFNLNTEDSIELFNVNEIEYFLVRSKGKYSLFCPNNIHIAILEQIEILNLDQFKEHQVIWYRGKEKSISGTRCLSAFDLKNCIILPFDEQNVKHSIFKDALHYKFYQQYALSSNHIVFNPATLEVKDSFVGIITSHSQQLNKIVSHRNNCIFISLFNSHTRDYELTEIPIGNKIFKESYLSPNGHFLVLQDETNKYTFYDIAKNKTINFIHGSFLSFRNDGSIITEQDSTRAVKVIDPNTFQDITPPNYHHYRFVSPDGKLYAQVSSKSRYYNKLNKKELNLEEVTKLRQDLDMPTFITEEKEEKILKLKLEKNRRKIYNTFKKGFAEKGITDYNEITSHSIIRTEKHTEIGIIGTNIVAEVHFPDSLSYYNYSAFSYDNKYFGYVGKPLSKGLIHLFKIDFDEINLELKITDTYLSLYPSFASWVCGFSKNGYFATYDSKPNTYILLVDDKLFVRKTSEIELGDNIHKSSSTIYYNYENWNVIKEKSFLCFSPTGNYLALSEQGYEPLTLGGYGHQESNVVHIAKTKSGEIIQSFTDHGDNIKNDKTKKVTFVAFSEDEKRIMTLSSDGVVIIRDIEL